MSYPPSSGAVGWNVNSGGGQGGMPEPPPPYSAVGAPSATSAPPPLQYPSAAPSMSYPSGQSNAQTSGGWLPQSNDGGSGGYNPSPPYPNQYQSQSQSSTFSTSSAPPGQGRNKLNETADFAKRNAMEIGGAVLSYKMGGGLGKMFAAGAAADLAHKYQRDMKDNKQQHMQFQQNPGAYGGDGQYQQQHQSAQSGIPGVGGLIGKFKNVLGGGGNSGGSEGPYQGGGGPGGQYQGGGGPGGQYQSGGGSTTTDEDCKRMLPNGAKVQLVHWHTGRTLQIVKAGDGRLVFDTKGGEGPQAYNAVFDVVNDGRAIAFTNNGNFIMFINGLPTLNMGGGPRPECWFKARHVPEPGWMWLEADLHRGFGLSFDERGEPAPYREIGDYALIFRVMRVGFYSSDIQFTCVRGGGVYRPGVLIRLITEQSH